MNRISKLIAPAVAIALMGAASAKVGTEATRAFAVDFLNRYFIKHDMTAYQDLADPDFVQHDPDMGNGIVGYRAFFAKLAQAPKGDPTAMKHVTDMVLVDGDLFAVMHHSLAGPGDKGRLFVDLWRVKDGKIAEHWDVIQPIVATMPHQNGMACGNVETYARAAAWHDSIAHPTCGLPDPHVDRAASLATYRAYAAEVAKGDVEGAIQRYFADDYRQHSPEIADGKQGAIAYLRREWGDKAGGVRPTLGLQRIVAEGDLVLVHYLYTDPAGKQSAHVDIFRIRGGKIHEHWDLKQPVPARTASGNAMW